MPFEKGHKKFGGTGYGVPPTDFQIHWMKHYAHLEYYPHPEIQCHCPCQGKIPVKSFHRSYGIPQYITGHQMRGRPSATKGKPRAREIVAKSVAGRKEWWANSENRKKYRERMADPEIGQKIREAHQGKFLSDFRLELNKFHRGTLVEEEFSYFRSFRNFVNDVSSFWPNKKPIQYIRCSKFIRGILEEKNIERFDIVIFINFMKGATQFQLSDHYKITTSEVEERLENVEKVFSGVSIRGPIPPDDYWMRRIEFFDGNERDFQEKF